MFCPECGFDAEEARFCAECGAGLDKFRSSIDDNADDAPRREPRPAARTTGALGGRGTSGSRPPAHGQRPRAAARASQDHREPSRPATGSRLSPLVIWMAFAVIVVVIVTVVLVLDRTPTGAAGSAASSGQASAPIAADTSGSYPELVARANGLYDQGAQAFQAKDQSGVSRYFGAAATVYRAAWKKQPGDPGVGTDYATSLLQSGDTAGALKQVNLVLAKSPDYQNAHLNKGIYLQTDSQAAQQNGQKAKAASLLARAKAEFQKAIDIDPASAAGKKAAENLKNL
jgi:hypothetical protein